MLNNDLYILHFNDVYDIQEQVKDPVGGASRFVYVLHQLQKHLNTLTLFSGDIFAPSALSNIYRGDQMLYPIQQFNIDVACPGNHDFDYTIEHVESLFLKSKIPWVLSNVFNAETNQNFAHTLPHFTKLCNIGNQPFKIGFLGLAEEEWLGQIVEIPQHLIAYEDYLHCAERTVKYLREEEKCEFIIGLTHMRVPNDHNLIYHLIDSKIDLVLGGHDHMIYCEKINQSLFMKSGTNFKNLGIIRISLNEITNKDLINNFIYDNFSNDKSIVELQQSLILNSKFHIHVSIMNILNSIPQNIDMRNYVDLKIEEYNIQKQKIVCFSNCDLECRFPEVRNKETNLSNLYADILKYELDAEISFFNSGTLRADDIIHKGIITYKELDKIFPMPDQIVKFNIKGTNLLRMLENGVGKWPNFDGRFLGVSGIQFTFDPTKPQGSRIINVKINGNDLEMDRMYKAASQCYISMGFDGFLKIPDDQYIIDKNAEIQMLQTVLRVLDICRFHEELQLLDIQENEIKTLQQLNLQNHQINHYSKIIQGLTKINGEICIVIDPQIEGRIIKL
ncbi:unnamed protein product [Paramecium sonneborni]|uniref:5' nucleotidase n=1 Tax=Paramecium sonneborni TaxID=65129 RepID=A0A8S1QAA8_9CILI|nr:unnamed protein product [Paramecium sonneborni]